MVPINLARTSFRKPSNVAWHVLHENFEPQAYTSPLNSQRQGDGSDRRKVPVWFDDSPVILQCSDMPRKLRLEYPGAVYHVMSRGDQRDDIFLDDVDRHDFIKTLAEASQKTGWQVHAFCLMRNHYHLVLETPNANLVSGMAWLQSTYTIRLNNRHKLIGHVMSGRYKAQLVEGSGTGYLKTACDYVHTNSIGYLINAC